MCSNWYYTFVIVSEHYCPIEEDCRLKAGRQKHETIEYLTAVSSFASISLTPQLAIPEVSKKLSESS